VTYPAGMINRAIDLSGEAQIDFGPVGDFDGSDPFTIAVWVRGNGILETDVLSKISDAQTRQGFELILGDAIPIGDLRRGAQLSFRLTHHWPDDAIEIRTKARLPLSSKDDSVPKPWYHVVLAYDGSGKASGLSLWLNGKPEPIDVLKNHLTGSIRNAASLAVGDAAFQKKSLGKMGAVAKEGRTVLLVSHNMAAIRSLCERAILIEEGKIRLDGKPHHAITTYLLSGTADVSEDEGQVLWTDPNVEPPGCEEFCLRGIQLKGPSGMVQSVFEADKQILVEIYYEVRRPLRDARFYLHILTQEGENAFSGTDCRFREEIESPGLYRSTCIIPGGLMNRRVYTIEMSCYIPSMNLFLLPRKPYLRFTVSGVGNQASYNTSDGVWPGVVCPQLEWKIEKISRINEPPNRSVQS